MSDIRQLREQVAGKLLASVDRASHLRTFVGLDGFVDEIIHVVDKRHNAESFDRLRTIALFGERMSAAAGQSTNVEVVTQITKLGGNGPIMGNALASFGLKVTYLGCLGYPNLHPVFEEFARRAEVHSIAAPGLTDALEFEDGKIMVGKHFSLKEVNWKNIQERFGREKFASKFNGADFVGFVNWTMLPYMSDVWEAVLKEVMPGSSARRRVMFIDLADPEKRTAQDIRRALDLIVRFEKYFEVILGLNEKEAHEIGKVLGLEVGDKTRDGLIALAREIAARVKVSTLMVHPVQYALAVTGGELSIVDGPYDPNPKITTGAGDHMNSGFCLGKMLGFDNGSSLLAGVGTSGFYVRNAASPSMPDLAGFLRNWPSK